MPYITREDGERFVIPSYRDVLTAKQKSVLKKDILLLSQSYGEYITLQRKSTTSYEVAFSPDTGYLLGESIWSYFKRPPDMVYCEAIPGTTEAILVIVKSGGVYLDGAFPIESIPEELVIFLTQENNFEVYVSGDVPISEAPEPGKFSFEASSLKKFTRLDKPVFPVLPLLKIYQLQLVDPVLKAHGIGVFPIKPLLAGVVVVGVAWMMWSYMTTSAPEIEVAPPPVVVNPYEEFNHLMMSPDPREEILALLGEIQTLYTMPGWVVRNVNYAEGTITASVQSLGGSMQSIFDWAKNHHMEATLNQTGMVLTETIHLPARPMPTSILPIKNVLGEFIDRLARVYPGNPLSLGEFKKKEAFTEIGLTISVTNVAPMVIALICDQFRGLPLVLQSMSFSTENGNLSGTIVLNALGN